MTLDEEMAVREILRAFVKLVRKRAYARKGLQAEIELMSGAELITEELLNTGDSFNEIASELDLEEEEIIE